MTHRLSMATTTLAVLTILAPALASAPATAQASTGQIAQPSRVAHPVRAQVETGDVVVTPMFSQRAARPGAGTSLRLPTHRVAAGSTVTLTGRAPGKRRPVVLQERTTRGWKALTKTRTTGKGHFRTSVRASKPMTLRTVAPAVAHLRPVQSPPVVVRTVTQSGALTFVPPIADQGSTPSAPAAAAQAVATFTPALAGGPVILQSNTGDGWTTVARATQNQAGSASFDVTPGVRYRAMSGDGAKAPRTSAATARSFDLLFADDFSAPAADGRSPAGWNDQFRPAVPGRTCATLSPDLRDVTGGVLNLRAGLDPSRPEPCTYTDKGVTASTGHVLNTQVATTDAFSFTYGYAAARMKMPSQPGAHAGFWLLPKKRTPDNMPEWHDVGFTVDDPSQGAEVDVVEYWGAPGSRGAEPAIGSFVHWYTSGPTGRDRLGKMYPEAHRMKPEGDTWASSFHVFAVKWTPTEYQFMVDGQVYATETRSISQVPQYPVLSMLSSDYEIGKATAETYADSAEVDWVRVWAP